MGNVAPVASKGVAANRGSGVTPDKMNKKFHRSYESLEKIYGFVEQHLEQQGVGPETRTPVHFVIEELFTNMVKYNPGNNNEILVGVSVDEDVVTVSLTDFDVDPFDVTIVPDVDVDAPLEERTPGGLGLHLIHHLVDRIEYVYHDRQSRITFMKGMD